MFNICHVLGDTLCVSMFSTNYYAHSPLEFSNELLNVMNNYYSFFLLLVLLLMLFILYVLFSGERLSYFVHMWM